MRVSRQSLLVTSLPVAVLLAIALIGSTGCSKKSKGGNTPTAPVINAIPAGWEGVWSVRTIVRLCNTSLALLDTTIVDTLCAGTPVNEVVDLSELGLCKGSEVHGNDTSMSFSCNDSFDEGGCTGTFSLTLNGTINPTAGTSATTGRLSVNATPETGECQDVCLDLTQTGTRLGQDPGCPVTAHALRRVLASPALARFIAR
jgi:hypothetical protein